MKTNDRWMKDLIEGWCSQCAHHKANNKNDCEFVRAFKTGDEYAFEAMQKLFLEKGTTRCKYFKLKEK